MVALTLGEFEVIKEVATLSAKEAATRAYLTCPFLLLAKNERYGPSRRS